ncbi:YbaB/EbfC family nucleoid-associated protein [Streptomyces vinaceus]|uniref:YbaB/EbfC family nucleoid-associated protein n=1 Tax=Streptomyces vinaceus TaxID=1960 RepID=UPI0035DB23E8
MSGTSMEQRIAQAMAELEAVQAAVARAEAELGDASVTVRSKDRSVEVTVGPQGELASLRFLGSAYRTMEGAVLAAAVMEAAGEARTRMARQVKDTLEPLTRASSVVPELPGIEVDWGKIFGPDVLGEEDGEDDGSAAARRRRGGRRLRDEIDEDPEGDDRA